MSGGLAREISEWCVPGVLVVVGMWVGWVREWDSWVIYPHIGSWRGVTSGAMRSWFSRAWTTGRTPRSPASLDLPFEIIITRRDVLSFEIGDVSGVQRPGCRW